MEKKLTKLEFYKLAKTHFTKNKVGRVLSGQCPSALCNFLTRISPNLSEVNYRKISKDIRVAKNVNWINKNSSIRKYNTAFFLTDGARMKFINSQIESLTK